MPGRFYSKLLLQHMEVTSFFSCKFIMPPTCRRLSICHFVSVPAQPKCISYNLPLQSHTHPSFLPLLHSHLPSPVTAPYITLATNDLDETRIEMRERLKTTREWHSLLTTTFLFHNAMYKGHRRGGDVLLQVRNNSSWGRGGSSFTDLNVSVSEHPQRDKCRGCSN